jgi:hypothetical protein
MKVYITFAASMLINVCAAVSSAPLTKKESGGIMMRALQAQEECVDEGIALGLCLESAGVTDYEEISACAFCPLEAVCNTVFDSCSSSDVDNFYTYVQSCGVEACHVTCRDELHAGAECVAKGACPVAESFDAATNDAVTLGGLVAGFGGFSFTSVASVIYAVGGIM